MEDCQEGGSMVQPQSIKIPQYYQYDRKIDNISWTNSLGSYIEPVINQIYLLPANFKLNVKLSSQTTSSSFFLSQQYFLPAISQMTMKSSSHSPVSETTSKGNLPKNYSA